MNLVGVREAPGNTTDTATQNGRLTRGRRCVSPRRKAAPHTIWDGKLDAWRLCDLSLDDVV